VDEMPEKKRKEVLVKPPYLRVLEDPLIQDTTEVERLHVFQISKRIGKYLSGLVIAMGILLLLLSTQFLLSEVETPFSALALLDVRLLFTHELRSLLPVAVGILGVINTLCGLLLLTKE